MLPVIFRAGPITVYSLGLFLCLALFLACFIVWKQARIRGVPEEKVLDIYFLSIFGGLIFSRLAYVFSYWPAFSQDLVRILLFTKYPGFSVPVLIFALAGLAALGAKRFDLAVFMVLDVFAIAASVFSSFAGLGCLLDGCSGYNWQFFLLFVLLSLFLTGVFALLLRKMSRSPEVAELCRNPGLFFLAYLIFQLLSLLMSTWFTKSLWRTGLYFTALVGVATFLVVRYKPLFNYVYRAISQRRSRSN